MNRIFLDFLNLSITAGWVVLFVLAARLLLFKAPKWIRCLLWGIVGLRFIFPFSIESVMSLIPSSQTVKPSGSGVIIDSGIGVIDNAVNSYSVGGAETQSDNILFIIWAVGIAIMLAYAFISYFRIHKRVRICINQKDNVYFCDGIDTPFILGIIRPKIYIPSSLEKEQIEYVVMHEKAHIKRLDNIWKPIGFIILTLNWFNPLLWIGYALLCRDIENACDERVIRQMDSIDKGGYSEALLYCGSFKRMITVCPLAFGEVSVKQRVKSILSYKKPALYIVIFAVIAVSVLAVCLLTDPSSKQKADVSSGVSSSDIKSNVKSIVDKTLEGNITTAAALEKFYSDGDFDYYFPTIQSDYIIVTFNDGSETTVKKALLSGKITIADLDRFDIGYIKQEKVNVNPHFNAEVLEIHDGNILVAPDKFSNEHKISDKITVSKNVISTNPLPSLKVGDRVRIVYNGEVLESYPASIIKVFAIYSLDSNGNVIYSGSPYITNYMSGERIIISGSDAKSISNIIKKYPKIDGPLCKCMPDFSFTENGVSYGIKVSSDGYIRSGGGQVSLSNNDKTAIENIVKKYTVFNTKD